MKLGGLDIADVKIGDTQVDKVYQGADLVWQYVPPLPFEFTINTANISTGSTAADQFKLPLVSSLPLNAVVDWGDGTSDTITVFNQAETTHTYASSGTYTVSITGDLSGWQFNNGGDRLKMLNVNSWETLNISVNYGFYGCTNLTCTATDAPQITSDNLQGYFWKCSQFNGAVGNWDISNVVNIGNMFQEATIFNADISSWNTSNVVIATSLFAFTSAFNQDISTKTINLGQANEYIAWDVSKINSIQNIFLNATAFNQDIGNWNVSAITNMQSAFQDSAFDNGGSNSINDWDVSSVSVFRAMFRSTNFNRNISSWITSSATNMRDMFNSATAFNQDIGSWNISNVTNFSSFMANKTAANYSAANLDSIYNGWSQLSVQPNLSISFGTIKYNASSQTSKDILTSSPNNWTITDGGQV